MSRNTEPHQKCCRRIPEHSGPSEEIAPPIAAHSAIDLVRAGARPQRGYQRERRRVGHARRQPAEHARAEQHADRGRPRGEAVGRDREAHAEDQQQLAPVAVADRAEVQDRRGEAERVADRDEVQRHLRGVEFPADLGQRDVGDREAEVGDGGDRDQRREHERADARARCPRLRRPLRGAGASAAGHLRPPLAAARASREHIPAPGGAAQRGCARSRDRHSPPATAARDMDLAER